MKAENFREMNAEERSDRLEQMQKQLFEMRSQSVTEKLENSMAMKNLRRDIARLMTVIKEEELKAS